MNKKILIGIGIVVLVLLVIIFFIRGGERPTDQGEVGNLPFGSGDGINFPGDGLSTSEQDELIFDNTGVPITNLFRISDSPVAGGVPLTKGGQTIARYVERATGHVVEVILPKGDEKVPIERNKITNITMPKIYEAYFSTDASSILLRSLKNDDTQNNTGITLTAPTGTTTDGLYKLSATVLRGDIGSVAAQGNNLFYTLNDSGTIVTSNFSSGALRTIFSSAFTEWAIKPAGTNILIYTKPSEGVMGYAYLLNPSTGALTKVLGPLESLSVTPNSNGTRLAYSYKVGGLIEAESKNLQTGNVLGIIPASLAEKCAWGTTSPNLLYCGVPIHRAGLGEPDNWYAGVTTFTDRIWMFDTNTELAEVISEPEITQDLELDVYRPQISPLGDYLIFMNKRDLSLWALKF